MTLRMGILTIFTQTRTMKYFTFLFFLLPLSAIAQTGQDYQEVMDRFVVLYNNDQPDSICAMMTEGDGGCSWADAQQNGKFLTDYGDIKNYKYLGIDNGDPEKVTVFKVIFSKKGPKAMSFTLGSDNRFRTFRFTTFSPGIRRMLEHAK